MHKYYLLGHITITNLEKYGPFDSVEEMDRFINANPDLVALYIKVKVSDKCGMEFLDE